MKKGAKCGGISAYELMPRELLDMCLGCRRARCPGSCSAYKRRERELMNGGKKDKNGNPVGARGKAAKTWPFRGKCVTVKHMAVLCERSESLVHRRLREGMSMEDIYRLYGKKSD